MKIVPHRDITGVFKVPCEGVSCNKCLCYVNSRCTYRHWRREKVQDNHRMICKPGGYWRIGYVDKVRVDRIGYEPY